MNNSCPCSSSFFMWMLGAIIAWAQQWGFWAGLIWPLSLTIHIIKTLS